MPTDRPRRSRWTSFVADAPDPGRVARQLHEEGHPEHRLRVEHDQRTILIHLADEDGTGWTTIGVDRESRQVAVAHARRQADSARAAHGSLYD